MGNGMRMACGWHPQRIAPSEAQRDRRINEHNRQRNNMHGEERKNSVRMYPILWLMFQPYLYCLVCVPCSPSIVWLLLLSSYSILVLIPHRPPHHDPHRRRRFIVSTATISSIHVRIVSRRSYTMHVAIVHTSRRRPHPVSTSMRSNNRSQRISTSHAIRH